MRFAVVRGYFEPMTFRSAAVSIRCSPGLTLFRSEVFQIGCCFGLPLRRSGH